MIKVIIADDHAIVRKGLRQILSETNDMDVVGEVSNGLAALKVSQQLQWDVFLLDISMPNKNGITTLKALKEEFPTRSVLILSMHPEDQYAIRALKAGASGYLNKQSAPDDLIAAIKQVANGGKYISNEVASALAESILQGDNTSIDKLSDRELQVLVLLCRGNTLSKIANDLSVSIPTVSTYRARILEKLRLKNTADLIRYGLEHDLG